MPFHMKFFQRNDEAAVKSSFIYAFPSLLSSYRYSVTGPGLNTLNILLPIPPSHTPTSDTILINGPQKHTALKVKKK